MDNLLFYALLAALALYFFYYLPSQKKTSSHPDPFKPTTGTQSTQTYPLNDYEPDPETLIGPSAEFPSIQTIQTPGSFPFSNQECTELEQTLDFLIKEMRDLDKSLDVPF